MEVNKKGMLVNSVTRFEIIGIRQKFCSFHTENDLFAQGSERYLTQLTINL